jgi:CubicO group peptidase (beta-lactamase class C family)
VVDLASGEDPVGERPFTRESLVVVASCTKVALATCVLMLADSDAIDLDAPVATYWPEFGQAGKAEIPVRWVLSHQAGLPYPDPQSGLDGLDQFAGPALVAQLEAQAPWWPPGTAFAYHPITVGTILGELVRASPARRWAGGSPATSLSPSALTSGSGSPLTSTIESWPRCWRLDVTHGRRSSPARR